MTDNTDEFFLENIVRVNKSVAWILLSSILVPVIFSVFDAIGIWDISNLFSYSLLGFQLFIASLSFIFIRKQKYQYFTMYMEVLDTTVFVMAMAYTGVIRLSISYAIPSILSCLYYNRKLSRSVTIANFILVVFITWLHMHTDYDVVTGRYDAVTWFIQMVIGYVAEFVFLYLIIEKVSRRTQKTLQSLTSANSGLENTNRELAETQFNIIQFVAKCLGSHDLFTGRHVLHTQKYVELISKQLREDGYYTEELNDYNIDLFSTAAFLHDIGKIHIPEGVLNKIGKFTPEEFDLMKNHPEEGLRLLEALPAIEKGKFNVIAKEMAYCHHEKWDGTGYPRGLKETQIPLCARIMAAADVLDALVSQRLYKDPMSIDEAIEVFRKSSGLHFEPCIAQAVIKCKPLIILIDRDFKTAEAATNAEELEWWQRYHDSLKRIQPN